MSELASLSKPPQAIKEVMVCVAIYLGMKKKDAIDWANITKMVKK
jgi:hypothetical protein